MYVLKTIAKKYFFILASPLFWILSMLIPKNNRLWVFGSWFGQAYSDNTKYMYQEAIKNSNIDAIWITKSSTVINQIKNIKGARVYSAYSIRGLFIQLRARVFCMTINSNDFYFPMLNPRNIQIQFWHGSPIKKICFDSWHGFEYFKNKVRSILIDKYDFLISPSQLVDELMKSAFQLTDSNIIRSAYPRCDGFYISDLERVRLRHELCIPDENKLFVYMPTHRNEGARPEMIKGFYEDFKSISSELMSNKISIVIKPHFYELENSKNIESIPGVKIVTSVDAYKLLGASDGLITDVSSICFDYEVTKNPIVFFMPDIDLYEKEDRETYFRLSDVANIICRTRGELLRELIIAYKDIYYSGLKVKMNEDFGRDISARLLTKLIDVVSEKNRV